LRSPPGELQTRGHADQKGLEGTTSHYDQAAMELAMSTFAAVPHIESNPS